MKLTEDEKYLLKQVIEHFDDEDRAVRHRQIRTYRRLKLFWDGFQRVWYDAVAHDWRIWDEQRQADSSLDQSYYDKPVNIFRAYLESIIAALSVTIPPITCYPDDADNALDLQTARAGNKIAELVYRHNDIALVWLHALFIYCTEGMIAAYNYPKKDKKYGTYQDKQYQDYPEEHESKICPNCGYEIEDRLTAGDIKNKEENEYMPDDEDAIMHDFIFNEGQELCPACATMVDPQLQRSTLIVTRLVGITDLPKSRQCIECYGGLFVKTPVYARTQEEMPYLAYSFEEHFAIAKEKYPEYSETVENAEKPNTAAYDQYEMWARVSTQYQGQYPDNLITERHWWLRPAAFNILQEDETRKLKKKFPDGAHVTLINDECVKAENENLDDCWTVSVHPLSDYLQQDPMGLLLVSLQEITNDLLSLILQTIEHGIPQTFADPGVLNFDQYKQLEAMPGAIIPTKTVPSNKQISTAFYEVKTASLSGEVLPFSQNVQSLAQLVSGALPSLFGGAMQGGGETASEYSMSRAQALQRQQTVWKILTLWWKNVFGKVIPSYIKEVKEDERYVSRKQDGSFINTFIRKAELEGKIGSIELEANENLPITWNQKKDLIMQLLQAANPEILAVMAAPENLPVIREAIGLTDFFIPGEDDRNAEYEEINQLLNSTPMPGGVDEMGQPTETPSVEVDPILDNHQIRFEIDRAWLISDTGRLAKIEKPDGYKNILLHAQMHYMFVQQQQMMEQMQEQGAAPNKKANPKDKPAPIQGEEDVVTQ